MKEEKKSSFFTFSAWFNEEQNKRDFASFFQQAGQAAVVLKYNESELYVSFPDCKTPSVTFQNLKNFLLYEKNVCTFPTYLDSKSIAEPSPGFSIINFRPNDELKPATSPRQRPGNYNFI